MRKNRKTLAALLLLGLGAGVFCVTLVRATILPPIEEEGPAPSSKAATQSLALDTDKPARLRIPALGVDAAVQHVGIGKSGNMAVPTNFTDVGWYRFGTVPGFTGSAVMDGHVDNGLALAGVFKHLSELKVGDEVTVETKGGETKRFRVIEMTTYNYKEVPTEKLFNRADGARLNLVTCDGAWIAGEKTYDQRLIVYTVLI